MENQKNISMLLNVFRTHPDRQTHTPSSQVSCSALYWNILYLLTSSALILCRGYLCNSGSSTVLFKLKQPIRGREFSKLLFFLYQMVIKDNRMEDFTTEEDQSHLGFYVGLDIFELIVKLKFTSQNTKKKKFFSSLRTPHSCTLMLILKVMSKLKSLDSQKNHNSNPSLIILHEEK